MKLYNEVGVGESRYVVLRAMGEMGSPYLLPHLTATAVDKGKPTPLRVGAIEAMRHIPREMTRIPLLTSILVDYEDEFALRFNALLQLLNIASKSDEPQLRRMLRRELDSDED